MRFFASFLISIALSGSTAFAQGAGWGVVTQSVGAFAPSGGSGSGDPTVGLLPTASDGYAGWSVAGLNAIPFTASIDASGTMTVTASPSQALGPGQTIAGAGVASGTTITAFGTGSGGAGTYTVSPAPSAAVSSEAMTAKGIPARGAIYTTLTACSPTLATTCNDTTAINTALTNCPAGEVVLLNAGVFQINGNGVFLGQSGCTLRGSGPGRQLSTGLNKVDGGGTVRGCTSGTLKTIGDGSFCIDSTATQLIKMDRATDLNDAVISVAPLGLLVSGSTNLASDAVQGAYSVTLASAPSPAVHVGDIVGIDENTDNDPKVWWGPNNDPAGGGSRRWFGFGPQSSSQNRQDRSLAQLFEVAAVNGNTITFDTPINYPYHVSGSGCSGCDAQLVTWGSGYGSFIHAVGIENLFVWGGEGGEGFGNVSLSMCAYCWVANVEAAWANGIGVGLYETFRGVLRDSFVHETPVPNPGGGGYLVEITAGSSEDLIENNILWYGNKVDVMKATGGGNVLGYNYTDDSFGDTYPDSPEAGINAGHYTTPHLELLEGNYSDNFKGDTFWGNSIYITAFRNWFSGVRAAHAPLNSFTYTNGCLATYGDYTRRGAVDVQANSFNQAFVGNVLGFSGQTLLTEPGPSPCNGAQSAFETQTTTTSEWTNDWAVNNVPMWMFGTLQSNTAPNWTFVDTTINTQTRVANWDWLAGAELSYAYGSTSTAANPVSAIPNSFYLASKPAFFGTQSWPWVDPTTGTTYTLPAKYCFEHGEMPTCLQ